MTLAWLAAQLPQDQLVGLGIAGGILLIMFLIIFIKVNLVICEPNEVVIISGRQRKQKDGSVRGYRILRGGRGLKLPIIETVKRISLSGIPLEVQVSKVLSNGLIPMNVEVRAQVKVAGSQESGLDNAIERFLGKPLQDIAKAAQQTLEGNLRGVMAGVSPEEANAQRLELGKKVVEQSSDQLHNLGIVLDFFQIQDISDKQGYLEAIGRKKNAQVQKEARIAEATAAAEARSVEAEQQRIGTVAEATSKLEIADAENKLATHRAELAVKTNQAEERAAVAGRLARIEEEHKIEEARVLRNAKRHEANIVTEAKAQREASELKAAGEAAKIIEDGKATAEAIRLMREQWDDGKTRELFLIQLLPELLDQVTRVVADNLHIEKLTVLDSGDGNGLPSYVKNLTGSTVAMIEQMKNATGLDLPDLLQQAATAKETKSVIPKELD